MLLTLCCVLGQDILLLAVLSVPPSTQVYQWVPVNLKLQVHVTPQWTTISHTEGSRNIPSCFMRQKLAYHINLFE